MVDVLIYLDNGEEKKLRELARDLHGGKKGSLSETKMDKSLWLCIWHLSHSSVANWIWPPLELFNSNS